MTPKAKYIRQRRLPCEIPYPLTVSERTARNWLVKLNFSYQDYNQGSHYIDGHERPDVVSHRKFFVDEMALWQKRMETYEGSDMEICVAPRLEQEQSRIVLVVKVNAYFKHMMVEKRFGKMKRGRCFGRKGKELLLWCQHSYAHVVEYFNSRRKLSKQNPHVAPDCTKVMQSRYPQIRFLYK
jgi:hypothetical protein